jgi:uncharacterized protein YjiS (DUF1127 family)
MFGASQAPSRSGDFSAVLWRALGWPARVIEARHILAQLAQMSDRELSDIGPLHADRADRFALAVEDDPSERLARARAIRAWYGHSRCNQAV